MKEPMTRLRMESQLSASVAYALRWLTRIVRRLSHGPACQPNGGVPAKCAMAYRRKKACALASVISEIENKMIEVEDTYSHKNDLEDEVIQLEMSGFCSWI